MGRIIPMESNPSGHSAVSLTLIVAFVAATIAVVSSLCGILSRKKPPPPPPVSDDQKPSENFETPTSKLSDDGMSKTRTPPDSTITTPPHFDAIDLESEEDMQSVSSQPQHLPPPPGTGGFAPQLQGTTSIIDKSRSRRKLSTAMSVKIPALVSSVSRQFSRRELMPKHLKHEDSIWKKTIILGEKCRVPDNEEDDDMILRDEKGNRISTYHPKNPSSLPVSRQTSYIDPDAVPK